MISERKNASPKSITEAQEAVSSALPNVTSSVGVKEQEASMVRSFTEPTSVNSGVELFQFLMLCLLPLRIPGNVAQVFIVFPERSISAVMFTKLVASAVVSSLPAKSATNSSAVAMSLGKNWDRNSHPLC